VLGGGGGGGGGGARGGASGDSYQVRSITQSTLFAVRAAGH